MKQQKPILHGRDHCPSGADPIPCLITAPAGDATYPETVLANPCLVHYWPADEPSGDLIDRVGAWNLADFASGGFPTYGAAGPLTGLPALTSVVDGGLGGPAGVQARFAYAYTGTPWAGTGAFTIEMWLYLTAYGTAAPNYAFDAGGGGDEIAFYVNGSPAPLSFQRQSTTLVDTTNFPLNSWQHVVGTFNGTTLKLYRNGALVASGASVSGNSANGTASFLNRFLTSWAPWIGRGAQLAIYNCALTDAEILAHYSLRDTDPDAAAGLVLQSDGDGGTSWAQVGTASLEDEAVTPEKILPGDDGQVLTTVGAAVDWADPADPPEPAPKLRGYQFGPMPGSLPSSSGMFRVPYLNGAAVTFTLDRATLHLETSGSTTSTLILEKSTTAGSFFGTTVATLTLGSGATDATVTASLGTVASGNLIRWRWSALGTGAANYYAQLEAHS